MKVAIIGMGEIGSNTLEKMYDIAKKRKYKMEFYCVDIVPKVLQRLRRQYKGEEITTFTKNIPTDADVYIVSVYTNEQVMTVVEKITDLVEHVPLVVIESTIDFKTADRLRKYSLQAEIVLFPHRFNPGDPEHAVFNLNRTIGGTDKYALNRAVKFYKKFMSEKRIIQVPYFIASLSKPLENAYRYIEIAIAEDWKMECDRLGIPFDEMRDAINTKWNIDLKEARDGIGGKCLPKDIEMMSKFFTQSKLIKTAMDVDKRYRENLKGGKGVKKKEGV